ncbi:MAG: isoprenyl transferase [Micrococcales bacterium]|nr:isoprenyl transferase [Micrococcales bacterium]
MGLRDVAYSLYERRLLAGLDPDRIPRHVGVILDGNRRWASLQGTTASAGHRVGGEKIAEFLRWCDAVDVEVVTLWLLSTDNLARPREELDQLLGIITDTVEALAAEGQWHIHPVGALDLLPDQTANVLKEADAATRDINGMTVNVAVGYCGRREVVDAVRSLLVEHADRGTSLDDLAQLLEPEHIAEHLYTRGQPDPDLVIRTSGEQRLSGFLLWQSAHSEFYFCEAYWPDFRRVDFLRAMRAYADRQRRFGG